MLTGHFLADCEQEAILTFLPQLEIRKIGLVFPGFKEVSMSLLPSSLKSILTDQYDVILLRDRVEVRGPPEIENLFNQHVTDVAGNNQALAILYCTGEIKTWGEEKFGGDCSEVKSQLKNICQLFSTEFCIGALTRDETFIPWGMVYYSQNSENNRGEQPCPRR